VTAQFERYRKSLSVLAERPVDIQASINCIAEAWPDAVGSRIGF
jgi:hypothetical protein